jgi:hypothetical protein
MVVHERRPRPGGLYALRVPIRATEIRAATTCQIGLAVGLAVAFLLAGCASGGGRSPAGVHSVDWGRVTIPGAVCAAPHAITLRDGKATIAAPSGVSGDRPHVLVESSKVRYGSLTGSSGREAALNVSCSSTGGTADGQLADSWVIYSTAGGSLRQIGTLVPQQPSSSSPPPVPYFDHGADGITMQRGDVTVHEVWYRTDDATCCPSITATTVWRYAHGAFAPVSTVEE